MKRLLALAFVIALWTPMLSAVPLPRYAPVPQLSSSRVAIDTEQGRIVIQLYPQKAPITVKNFLHYVDTGFYDGTIFHRVIPDFMIQGGGHVPGLTEKKSGDPIRNESDNGLCNERGTISMARTAVPDSATVQFFINTKDNPFIDRANSRDKVGYCVFGKVVEGMDVIDKIRLVPTGQQGIHSNVPVQDVVIRSIRRLAE